MGERTKLGLGIAGAALVLGLLGDGLLRATPWGLNVFLFALPLVGLAASLAVWRGVSLRGGGRFLVAPLLLFAALFAWRDSDTLAVINGLSLLVALSLAVLRSRSGSLAVGLSGYLYWGLQTAFYACAGPVPLLLRDVSRDEIRPTGYGPLLAVLRGLAIAVPLLLIFGALFAAADAVFQGLVAGLFDFDPADLIGHLLLAAFFAWVSAGLLRLALIGGELPAPQRPAFLGLGIVELGVSLGLLNGLFLLFVAVQARYLFGGEGRILQSTGLTYAEYARRGFFELVTVTALVLPLLLLAHWLLRSEKPLHVRIFRILSASLVALLFIVMASALQRMRLYTAELGLTELRLYTTAFMAWIFIVLVFFLLTVLRARRRLFAPSALATGFLAVVLLNALNPDAFIVRTNLARAEKGQNLDASYLASLSADAVPPLITALPRLPERDRSTIEAGLKTRWTGPTPNDWRTYNLSRSRAREAATDLPAIAGPQARESRRDG